MTKFPNNIKESKLIYIREYNIWIIFFIPFGGAFVSYLYYKYGNDSLKGNDLIIQRINEGEGHIPFMMASLVFFGVFITHLFED